MNHSYFIARKVAASGGRSLSRTIIRAAIIAVAISMAVMIAATCLIAGFKRDISEKIFGFWGHIHIVDATAALGGSVLESYPVSTDQSFYPELDTVSAVPYWDYRTFLGREIETQQMTKGGIRHIQTYALKPGIIKAKDEIEGIILKGVGEDFDWSYLQQYIVAGEPLKFAADSLSRDILVSQQTADRLRVGLGDRFEVHFVEGQEQVLRRFTISGIYKTGLEEYDRQFALVDIRQVQRLWGWRSDQVSGFEVFVDDISDLDILTEYVFEEIPMELYAESIRSRARPIFDWLDLQDINEQVILSLMLVVAIINMITALLILILERTNMIGILKALGDSNWSIRKIFLYYSGYIIVFGLLFGNFLGLGLCWVQDTFEIITLDEENYYLSVAPVEFNWAAIILLNVGTLAITLLFLLIPSYLVTRVRPVKAIRFR